jgi:hypothetical protein
VEYREDLFVQLLAGLPQGDQQAVMQSIDRATAVKRHQIRRAALSEQERLAARHAALGAERCSPEAKPPR